MHTFFGSHLLTYYSLTYYFSLWFLLNILLNNTRFYVNGSKGWQRPCILGTWHCMISQAGYTFYTGLLLHDFCCKFPNLSSGERILKKSQGLLFWLTRYTLLWTSTLSQKKGCCQNLIITLWNLNQFQKLFTNRKSMKFAITRCVNSVLRTRRATLRLFESRYNTSFN